jgi:tetratricopeptide (TPR) repeat protein
VQEAIKAARSGLRKAEEEAVWDSDAAVAFSALEVREHPKEVRERLEAALRGKQPLRETTRVQALVLLGRILFDKGHSPETLEVLNQLTRTRRSGEDWEFLLMLARARQDRAGELRALEHVLEIAPQMESSHYLAAEIYEQMGETERAKRHQRIALQLARHLASERHKALRRGSPK